MKLSDKIIIKHEKIKSIKAKQGEIPSTILFNEKMSVAVYVLNTVSDFSQDKKVLNEARKNYTINCVTALEVYLKDSILNYDFIHSPAKYENLLKDKVSLFEAYQMFNEKKMDVKDVIVSQHSFQNLEKIDWIFSTILGEKYLSGLEIYEVDETKTDSHFFKKAPYTLKHNYPKWRHHLKQLFELRHEIVHQVNFKSKVSYNQIKIFHATCYAFVIASDFYLRASWSRFFDKIGKEMGCSGREN